MKRAAGFLVDNRIIILALFLALAAASAFLIPLVEVNYDMSKYLPPESRMKQGIELMNREFGEAFSSDLRVMFSGLSEEEKGEIYDWLSGLDDVSGVTGGTGASCNKDGYTLFEVSANVDSHSPEAAVLYQAVHQKYDGRGVVTGGSIDEGNVPLLPAYVLAIAYALIMAILFTMCNSWFEPVLFLVNIVIAVIINMGTNVILGPLSEYTEAIVAVMQLVLSMDYSIILLNRYSQEKAKAPDNLSAMKAAIAAAFPAVTSSSLTTFVGLLSLVFMSFRIGEDMGVALAKSVIVSLICIFTVLPALILMTDRWIERTRKKALHIPMGGYSRLAFKGRAGFVPLFAALFVGAFFLRSNTEILYMLQTNNQVDAVFDKSNALVLLYEARDGDRIGRVMDGFEGDGKIQSVTGYYNTLGRAYRAEEIVSLLGDEGGLDPAMIRLVYADRFLDAESLRVSPKDLFAFIQDQAASGSLPMEVDEETLSRLTSMRQLLSLAGGELTAAEFARRFGGFSDLLDENTASLLYLYYAAFNAYDDAWAMTPGELVGYISDQLLEDQRFSAFVTDEVRQGVAEARTQLAEGAAQLEGERYGRVIITSTYPEDAAETRAFLHRLSDACGEELEGEYYLIGSSAMNEEMSRTFHGEMNRITLITAIAIFAVVALTFRSLGIPLILVLIVQCGVFLTTAFIGMSSSGIYYMAILIVQCILMGATIDYGILYTTYYREHRRSADRVEALRLAYDGALHTILTSSMIMTLVTGVLGFVFANPAIGEICLTISKGAACATVLVIFVLPGILAAADRWVIKDGK